MLILFLVLGFSGIFEEENEDEQEDESTSGFFKRALRRRTPKPPEGGTPNPGAHAQIGILIKTRSQLFRPNLTTSTTPIGCDKVLSMSTVGADRRADASVPGQFEAYEAGASGRFRRHNVTGYDQALVPGA
jgi:hypothetical protein